MEMHVNIVALRAITHISALPHFLIGNWKNMIDLHALFNYIYSILCIFSKKATARALPDRQVPLLSPVVLEESFLMISPGYPQHIAVSSILHINSYFRK